VIELDPWGGETDRCVNQRPQPYRYTSYERDGDGVDQALMRSYHGWWARFNEPDPWEGSYDLTDPQSFNRYTYVQNDPVNYVDPSGLDRFCIIDVSYRHFEYINKDGDQTIRIETILHQTCFDMPTAPIGGGYNGDIGSGGALASVLQTLRPPASQDDGSYDAKCLVACIADVSLNLGAKSIPIVGGIYGFATAYLGAELNPFQYLSGYSDLYGSGPLDYGSAAGNIARDYSQLHYRTVGGDPALKRAEDIVRRSGRTSPRLKAKELAKLKHLKTAKALTRVAPGLSVALNVMDALHDVNECFERCRRQR
jgi:RHS repeat-associated protein